MDQVNMDVVLKEFSRITRCSSGERRLNDVERSALTRLCQQIALQKCVEAAV